MAYYPESIDSIFSEAPEGDVVLNCTASLTPNPNNQHDPNAVEVRIDDFLVGHLYRESALQLHTALDQAGTSDGPTTCDALLTKRFNPWHKHIQIGGHLAVSFEHPAKDRSPFRPRHRAPVFSPLLCNELVTSKGVAIILVNSLSPGLASRCFAGMEVEVFASKESGNVHFGIPGALGGSGRLAVLHVNDLAKHGISAEETTARILSTGEMFVSIWMPITAN